MGAMAVSGVGQTPPQPAAEQRQAYAAAPLSERENAYKSLPEMMQEAREKAEEQRKRLQVKTPVRYGDAPMEAYARLSRARNTAEVNAAAGYARRRMIQFKAAKGRDKENAEQIQAAINQLQKAVTRAGRKKRDLEREKLADVRRTKLERENQTRQAQRLRQELSRKKTMRKIREGGYLREAEIDSRQQTQLAATRMELRAQAQALAEAVGPSIDAAVQQYTVQAAAAAPVSGGEISVQA